MHVATRVLVDKKRRLKCEPQPPFEQNQEQLSGAFYGNKYSTKTPDCQMSRPAYVSTLEAPNSPLSMRLAQRRLPSRATRLNPVTAAPHTKDDGRKSSRIVCTPGVR